MKKATISYANADKQVRRYLTGTPARFSNTLVLGGYIEGECSYLQYNIIYYSIGPGVIVYEVYNDNGNLVPIPSPSRENILKKNRLRNKEYQARGIPSFSISRKTVENIIEQALIIGIVGGITYIFGPEAGAKAGRVIDGLI